MLFFKVVEDLVMYHDALKRLVEKAAVQATLELSKIFRFDTETETVGRLACLTRVIRRTSMAHRKC